MRTALPGTVTYAGPLAGRGVVVVDHGETRTTYEPVAASVSVGDVLAAGDRIGTLQVPGSHCFPRACLHWGWIRGETYLDPLRLVGAGPVRLLPLWRDAPAAAQSTVSGLPYAGWSGPWVRLLVGPPQPFGGDVGVELGGGQRRVAEQLLHRAQVGAALEQVGGRRVPQAVRAHVRRAGHVRQPLVHERRDRALVDPPSPGAEEQRGSRALDREAGRPWRSQKSRACAAGRPNGTERSLRPLPNTRTTLRSRSMSSTSSPTSSPTRIPVA